MIEWTHIMDSQPEDNQEIIHCEWWAETWLLKHRNYYQGCSWSDYMEYYQLNDLPKPNFWWVYAEDFPFPKMGN